MLHAHDDDAAMKLYPDKLDAHLSRGAAPVYLLHGDEPLQSMEIGDRLRAHAREAGFDEREVIFANEDADWAQFRESADSLSLFAEKRLIELRLMTGKPGRVGSEVLKQYCANPPDDVFLLITSAKLDRGGSSSAWFKAIDKVGVTMALYPVPSHQLPKWLADRLARRGLQASPEALSMIAERVEGNMLAAEQEVQRLALLHPSGTVSADEVLAAVADSARYSIGDLSLAALEGQPQRALRVLAGLREEAVAEVLILWSLSQEIRAATRVAEATAVGVAIDRALKAAGVWQNRAAPLKKAVARHDAAAWLHMLSACTTLDRQIKGQAAGDVWDSFSALVTQLASTGDTLISTHSSIPA